MEEFENLNEEEITEALEKVNHKIKMFDEGVKFTKGEYETLLSDRIYLNRKLNLVDEIVKAAARGDKYPSILEYKLEGDTKVVLEYKSAFLIKADALVNAIDVDRGFVKKDNSSVNQIVDRVGDVANKAFNELIDKTPGNFVVLDHSDLAPKMSYQILYYKDRGGEIDINSLDLDILEKGIQNVLADCGRRGLKTVSFYPLGFDYVLRSPVERRSEIANILSDRTAETIVQYFVQNPKTTIKVIHFGFVRFLTMRTFDIAFHKWSAKTRQELYIQNELSRVQKNLIAQNNTEDEKFKKILRDISFSLSDESTIVLLGETGVGKSYISEILHNNSNRKHMPHIAVNCAVFSKNLAEPSLFGYVQGSHSEAKEEFIGPIEKANGGTIFLDEIGTLDKDVQKILLTFLDKGFFNRFGDYSTKIHSDVKLIFGTNADLEALVAMGKFAHDFYERIHHWVFTIPPLRERRGDIKILLELFLEKMIQTNKYPMEIERNAEELLSTFNWYGNVRQLKLYIEKQYIKCKGENLNKITTKIINTDPPRNTPITSGNDQQLESLLRYFISKWDKDKGKLLRDVIEPMAAKIYIDGGLPVSRSSEFLGLTGSRKNSPLHINYSKYNEAIKKLKNL